MRLPKIPIRYHRKESLQRALEVSAVCSMSLTLDSMAILFLYLANSATFAIIRFDLNTKLPLHIFFSIFALACSLLSLTILLFMKSMKPFRKRRIYLLSVIPILLYTFISGIISWRSKTNPFITILLLLFFVPFVIVAHAVFRDEYASQTDNPNDK